jgi:hypothetical protein
MVFSKAFARYTKKSTYPIWEEVYLNEKEEKETERKAASKNIATMINCLNNAFSIFEKNKLKPYQSDVIAVAVALFEKRASHEAYFKEEKCREIFDNITKKI